MGDVIDFPKKERFMEKYGAGLAPGLKDCLALGYDDVIEQFKSLPILNVKSGIITPHLIEQFKNDYRNAILRLAMELLVEKANICILQQELSQYRPT